MKKKVLILLMVLALLLGATPAYAAPAVNQASAALDLGVTPQAMKFIAYGETQFGHNGGGRISIYGEIWGYGVYDILGMYFNLQYWNGSQWVTLKTWNAEGYNRKDYSILIEAKVTTGFSYRVVTEYYIHEGSQSEYAYTYTSPLYIN